MSMLNENSFLNSQERNETMLQNTTEFRKALDDGDLETAEKFLNEVASNPDNFSEYDSRWLDHRQRELFQAFYKKEDWTATKRIVEATKDQRSKEGRKKRLEELSDLNYDEI